MAILKSFDPANYETKSITLAVSAGSSYTLGDAYTGGGRVVDIWGAEGFSSSVGAKSVDFVLSGIDKRLTSDYGTTYYTIFKSLTITGTVTLTYRRYGTYVNAGQINSHETRLGDHDSRLTAAEASNTAQDIRLTAIEQTNSDQDASITDISEDLSAETSARQSHESNTTDPHGATSDATANKIVIRDANGRTKVATATDNSHAVNKAQMDAAIANVLATAGTGTVNPSSTTTTVGYYPTWDNATGTLLGTGKAGATGATASTIALRDANADLTARKLISTIATGTAPLTVTSTTVNANLNADMVDGKHVSTTATADTIPIYNASAKLVGDVTGRALYTPTLTGVTELRAYSTTYTNTGNTTMTVHVVSSGIATVGGIVNGYQVTTITPISGGGSSTIVLTVPAGGTYRVYATGSSSITSWWEIQ